jgi:uncharacterized repeat protein (TIGR02543 family)
MKMRIILLRVFALVVLVAGAAFALQQAEPRKSKLPTEPKQILQFTSGGHILGFAKDCVYVASGSHALRVEFVNSRSTNPLSAASATDTRSDKKAAPLSQVSYASLWDGVTLTYDAPNGAIARTTYRLEPYANVANIRLRYNAPVSIEGNGSLRISFQTGTLNESAPQAWQEQNGKRVPVQVAFAQRGKDEIGFRTGQYNLSQPLFIDPTLTWTTFLGGGGYADAGGVAVDGSGNVYVVGQSYESWGSPVHAFNSSYMNSFAAKLDPNGNLIWNTFFGNAPTREDYDFAYGVAVDGSGNAYVVGVSSGSWGSPIRPYNPCDYSYGCTDGYLAKFDTNGNLTWNTFLGGDSGNGVAVDKNGSIYVVGGFLRKFNSSGNLIWQNTSLGGNAVAVDTNGNIYVVGDRVTKLDSSGNLIWQNTSLGGNAVAVDGSGNVYVVGESSATWGSPVRPFSGGGRDAFAAKLDSGGNLIWNTFLGGSGDDYGVGLGVDKSGNMYLAGSSSWTWGSPVRAYTPPSEYGGGWDAFSAKLDSNGNLIWNTFLGFSDDDWARGGAADGSGNVYVAGQEHGLPPDHCCGAAVFVAKLRIIATTVKTSINGLAFTVDGQTYSTTQILLWEAGSSHTIGTTSPQDGGTGVRYYFYSWSDGGAISHTVAPTTNTTYTAKFVAQYYLTMNAGTGGKVSPASSWRTAGTSVSISATPSAGYSFSKWTGSGAGSFSGTTNPVNITMNGPITETATFTPPVQVTVQTTPAGRAFSVDGTSYGASKTFSWTPGSSHTIATTSPQDGGTGVRYYFYSWSDGGAISHTVAPTTNTTYTAKFVAQYYLTMNAGTGGKVSPASSWRTAGTSVSISATPSAGYSFSNWTGSGAGSYSGTDNPRSITIMGPISETATFTHN